MKHSINLRKANILVISSLGILMLFMALATLFNPGHFVSANGGEPVRFDPFEPWSTNYTDAYGWNSDPAYWDTIQHPDINGDSIADVCGRGTGGIVCAVSDGTSLPAADELVYYFTDAQGWNTHESYWGTIRFPDVNGDGLDDVCGRESTGISCGLSNGINFSTPTNWNTSFGNTYGWKDDPSYWGTINFPDLNGDGMADICGRTSTGITCGLSNGQSFGSLTTWGTQFSNVNGWNTHPSYWDTIQFPDLDGDGMDDICGRASGGLICGLSTGSSFASQTYWTYFYGDNAGWKSDPAYWSTIQFPDVTGDGRDDVCGRASGGMYCSESYHSSTAGDGFFRTVYWENNFSDANGWESDPSYWGTIQFPDLNGDGMADVCGRAPSGIYCSKSDGDYFVDFSNWQPAFSNDNGWNSDQAYWGTIQFPDVSGDGIADVCGRAPTGIFCAPAVGDDPPPPTSTPPTPTPPAPQDPDFSIYLPFTVKS